MRNKLKSVTLVNSGEYQFSTIDIEGNVLLSGANGAGKSTFLRAVLFFYHPSLKRTDFGIDANKSSFLDYYFPYKESYLLYEYTNQYGRNYVLVFKPADKLRFKFFAMDNRLEIDLKSIFHLENDTLESEKVVQNFRKRAINESDTFVGVEEFQKIIYGQESRNKKSDVAKYALYNANGEYRHIGNTIKNIFLNHKIDADSIKALLVSNINENERHSIQLKTAKEQIDKFLNQHESIEQFSKNIKIAESIGKNRNDYIDLEDKQDGYIVNMNNRAVFIREEQHSLAIKMEERIHTIDEKKRIQQHEEENFLRYTTKLKNEKYSLETNIEEANRYAKAYHENNIADKLLKYHHIDVLKNNLEITEKEKEILVGKAEDRVKAFDNEIMEQENKKTKITNDENRKINDYEFAFLEEKKRRGDARNEEIKSDTKALFDEEEMIRIQESELKSKYQAQWEKAIELKHKKIYEEEISALNTTLLDLDNEKNTAESASKLLEQEIDSLRMRIEGIEQETKHKIEKIHVKNNVELEKIEEKITRLTRKIDFHPESFIAFLEQHEIPNKNQIFATVKDSLLTSTQLNPQLINQTETLYGITIEVPLQGNLDNLKEELTILDRNKRTLREEEEALITLIEEEAKKAIDKIHKERGDKYKHQKELNHKHIPSLKAQIETHKASLHTLKQKADIQKLTEQKEIAEEISKTKKELDAYQEKLVSLHAQKEASRSVIIDKYQHLEKEVEDKKTSILSELKAKTLNLLALCDEAIQSINTQKERMLTQEGISKEALAQLDIQIATFKKTINTHQSYEKEINEYTYKHKEKIEKLDEWKKALVTVNEVISQTNETHLHAMNRMKKEINAIESEKELYKKSDDEYRREIILFDQLNATDSDFSMRMERLKNKENRSSDNSYLTTKMDEYMVHRTVLIQDIIKCENDLRRHIGELFKKIARPELLSLRPNTDNSLEEFLRVSFDIEKFLEDKKIEMLIKETIRVFKREIRKFTRDIEDIQKHTGNITRQLNKIRKGINDLSGISVIDEIDMRLQESQNAILHDLANLKKIHDDYEMDYDENLGEGLFAMENQFQENNQRTEKEKKADKEIMRIFESLSKHIDDHKKESISLDECFEIEFKVSENNNESRWQSSLNGIGSEGTDIIVKILIYVSLLSLTKKECIKEDVDIHCLVDEIGKLSPQYFKEVIDFTNGRGIYFINGMPSEMLISSFKNHYKLRKIGEKGQKRTVATKIIYRINEEDNV